MTSAYNQIRRDLYTSQRFGQARNNNPPPPTVQFWSERYFGAAPENYNRVRRQIEEENAIGDETGTKNNNKVTAAKERKIWKPKSELPDHVEFHKKRREQVRKQINLLHANNGGEMGKKTNHTATPAPPATFAPTSQALLELLLAHDIPSMGEVKYPGERKSDFAVWDIKSKSGKKSHENFRKWLRNAALHLADNQREANESKMG